MTESENSSSPYTPSDGKDSTTYLPLRVWPVVLLIALGLAARIVPSTVEDGPSMLWMLAAFGPLLLSLVGMIFWWLAMSRATGKEKILGFLGVVAIGAGTIFVLDKSMLGPAVMVLTVPLGVTAFGVTLVFCSRMLSMQRTVLALLAALLGFGYSTLLQSDGMWGDFALGIDWRWNLTPEEEFLAERSKAAANSSTEDTEPEVAEEATAETETAVSSSFPVAQWSGFRGNQRDGVQLLSNVGSDWSDYELEELWRIRVGPAWSSFAVAEPYLFTQEQRGPLESVVCYDSETGDEVWTFDIESRFSDPLGGPGPRATPTLADGFVYSTGATGWLTKIAAQTGKLEWKVDLRKEAEREPPMWGFSSSPLVANGQVIVHAGGENKKGIIAFSVADGSQTWAIPAGKDSYGSLQQIEIAGRALLAILTNTGAQLIEPESGEVVLDYDWQHQGYRALQPQVVGEDRILIPTGMGAGTRMIRIEVEGESLKAVEEWTSTRLKPDFNDLVVLGNDAYGFNGAIFTSINLEKGEPNWGRRGGRYGKGQVVLIADAKLLVVMSEKGELVVVDASPEKHTELFKTELFTGTYNKTWNHPVVIGNRLYVRNANEAACVLLPTRSVNLDGANRDQASVAP